jgi:IS605 OrfB family transposase
MSKVVNYILEIRVKGDRKKKLAKFCNSYSHAKNLFYILINKNLDFFLEIGISDWSLNLLFTERINNRGDNEKKLRLKNHFQTGLLSNQDNCRVVEELKRFKKYAGNAIFQALAREVTSNYKSYFSALRALKENPCRFRSKPRLPKPKKLSKITNCSIQFSQLAFRVIETEKGRIIQLRVGNSKLKFKLPSWFSHRVSSVRVVKKLDDIYLQVLYKDIIQEQATENKNTYIVGIDLGLDNLLTLVSSNPNLKSIIISGKELKAFNQWYNKVKAQLQSENRETQRRKLERFRARRIKSIFHQITSKLVHLFLLFDIREVIIGKNAIESKQGINLGKKNNQQFVQIPFRVLLGQLKYKCEKFGIRVTEVDESYTSKCSALTEKPGKKEKYNGKRVKRGLFKDCLLNRVWNADCNGALNIIKKVKKDILQEASFQVWLDKLSRPIRIYLSDIQSSLYDFFKKVSHESLFKRIVGSTEVLKEPPCSGVLT